MEQRGYAEAEWVVCLDHVADDALTKALGPVRTEHSCTFCDSASADDEVPVAVSGEDFMEVFMDSFAFVYVNAQENLPWDSEEHAYFGPQDDTGDAVYYLAAGTVDEDVIASIVESIGLGKTWTRWRSPADTEDLDFSWEQFSSIVKHKHRFVFTKPGPRDRELDRVLNFLDHLAVYVKENLGLLTELPSGSVLYRGRLTDDPKSIPPTAAQLGPPPPSIASAGRWSPAGIPLFYAAPDAQTAIAEIAGHGVQPFAVVGGFTAMRNLRVIDFTLQPARPSAFDSEHRTEYRMAEFLESFVRLVTQPVIPDGTQHFEYVPTQIIAEYLRCVGDEPIDGIIVPSAATGEPTHAYFIDASQFATRGEGDGNHDRDWVPAVTTFELDPESVATYPIDQTSNDASESTH